MFIYPATRAPTNALPISHIEAFARYATYLSTSRSDSSSPPVLALSSIGQHNGRNPHLFIPSTSPLCPPSLQQTAISLACLGLLSSLLPPQIQSKPARLRRSPAKVRPRLRTKIRDGEAESTRLAKGPMKQGCCVGELALAGPRGGKVGREAIRTFVKDTFVREKERGKRLERCLCNARL